MIEKIKDFGFALSICILILLLFISVALRGLQCEIEDRIR